MFIKIVVLILVCMAVYFDLKTYRIPNELNGIGIVTGITTSIISYGMKGMLYSLIGIFIPFALLFILFGMKIIGAGDIKLLCAIGSFVYQGIFTVILLSFGVAALFGVVVVLRKCINNTSIFQLTRMHLSIPIAVATVIFLIVGG